MSACTLSLCALIELSVQVYLSDWGGWIRRWRWVTFSAGRPATLDNSKAVANSMLVEEADGGRLGFFSFAMQLSCFFLTLYGGRLNLD